MPAGRLLMKFRAIIADRGVLLVSGRHNFDRRAEDLPSGCSAAGTGCRGVREDT
jgi:hypothetical protein